MDDDASYHPIACGLHDRLEAIATLGQKVRLVVRARDGSLRVCDDRLVDVFARGGEELVRTAAGEVIRLDRLVSVDGVAFEPPADRRP